MKTKLFFMPFVLALGLFYSCSNNDEAGETIPVNPDNQTGLVKRITASQQNLNVWYNNSTNIYADVLALATYSYSNGNKIQQIDWSTSFSDFSDGTQAYTRHSLQTFTYIDDLITYTKYVGHNSVRELTIEYDSQQRITKITSGEEYLVTYPSSNTIHVQSNINGTQVSEIYSYENGNLVNLQQMNGAPTAYTANLGYDTKNNVFKNIKGYEKYLLAIGLLFSPDGIVVGWDSPHWVAVAGSANNLISENFAYQTNTIYSYDITYTYNSENYPIGAIEILSNNNGSVTTESSIEYFD